MDEAITTAESSIASAHWGPFTAEQDRRMQALHIARQGVDAGSKTHIDRAKQVLAFIEGTDDDE